MNKLKSFENIGLGVLSYLLVIGVFKLANLAITAWQGLIVLLLILIYFEITELNKSKGK